jgi:mannose-6-phosphate isomerase-like protein (cupin superfamily)
MGYTAVDVAELEREGPGGAVRKVRRALGARAFGFNYITLPAGSEGREHDHAEDGQEEVYVVVRGSGVMRVDGDEVDLRPGVFVRVDPDTTRLPVAGPDGLEFVTFGAPVDGAYEPPSWG